MKQASLYLSVLLTAALLLTACGPKVPTPEGSGSSSSVPLNPGSSAPLNPGSSSSSEMPQSIPLTPYLVAVSEEFPYQLCGLMTLQGEPVAQEECYEISLACCYSDAMAPTYFPVWVMRKQGPGWPENQEFVALYAEDGSWNTDFIYHGCTGTPHGLFVGDEQNAFLLDPKTGQTLKAWSWEELQIDAPEDIPWITGDAYATAQWTGEQLYLGCFADGKNQMLDLETGQVSSLTDEEWIAIQDARFNSIPYWTCEIKDHTAELTQEIGTEALKRTYTFEVPFDGDYSVDVEEQGGEARACFWNQERTSCALYTLEGEEIIPLQNGSLFFLGWNSPPERREYCLHNPEEQTASIYSWDGQQIFTIPQKDGDYVTLAGSLIQVTDYSTYASYYHPETGEKIASFSF